jgi:Flp pilus assembly protein protease CpaA
MSLIAEHNIWVFVILTIIGGGGAAYMGGRSLALGWKPLWMLVVYMCIFGAGLRFLHFALFQDTLTSLYYYIVQTLVILVFAWAGYQMTRASQMTEQYPWLYEKTGPFSWRNKA